jgi:hypothetical protein
MKRPAGLPALVLAWLLLKLAALLEESADADELALTQRR